MDNFREYELFSQRAQHMSERRQNASRTYLTVNTAILGILALLLRDAGLEGWELVVASIPLFLVGILACLIWLKIIVQFKELIGWRYQELRAMESDMPDSYQVYTNEWDKFFKPRDGKDRFSFSRLEAWLPRLFIGLYVVYGIGLAVATIRGWV